MAAALGVALRTYANYERDERQPDAAVLAKLVELGWNANWIMTGEGPERLPEGVDPEVAAKRAAALMGDASAVEWVGAFEKGFFSRGRMEAPPGLASHEVSGEHLMIAHELAEEALRGLWLPRQRFFDLVGLIYEGLTQGLPYAEILDFARPAAKEMAQVQGDEDGSDKGLGGKDPRVAGGRKAADNR